MRIGAWSSFDDLEDSLTLDELMELYKAQMDAELRLVKTLGRFMGAEFADDEAEEEAEAPIDRIRRNIMKRKGQDPNTHEFGNLGMGYKRL